MSASPHHLFLGPWKLSISRELSQTQHCPKPFANENCDCLAGVASTPAAMGETEAVGRSRGETLLSKVTGYEGFRRGTEAHGCLLCIIWTVTPSLKMLGSCAHVRLKSNPFIYLHLPSTNARSNTRLPNSLGGAGELG